MSSNSLLLYEIKNGNQLKKLIEQMRKRCHFICNYLKIFYERQIYYLGFNRDNTPKEFELSTESSQSSNENFLREEEENSHQKNEEKDKKELSSEENGQKDDKDIIINKINNEQTEKKKEQMDGNTFINKMDDSLTNINAGFSSLNNLPAKIKVFRLENQIFGEKLIYQKEELNLLGSLRDDAKIIKEMISKANKIKTTDTKLNNLETIILAIAKK